MGSGIKRRLKWDYDIQCSPNTPACNNKFSTQFLSLFPNRPQADPARQPGWAGKQPLSVESGAIIRDRERKHGPAPFEPQLHARGVGVADQIREGFLQSAVHQHLDLEIGLLVERLNAQIAEEALRDSADLPQLPQGFFETQSLPLRRV